MSSCDQFRELYEAYALGALDAAERLELEKHLATGCVECAQGIAEARWIVSSAGVPGARGFHAFGHA